MSIEMTARAISWEMNEPFRIARGEITHIDGIVVELRDGAGPRGRGEAYGIPYEGETAASMLQQVEHVRELFLARPDRGALLDLLPAGGARCALDSALWDLEAKRTGEPAWRRAGFTNFKPLVTAYTLGMRAAAVLTKAAAERAKYPLLKIKVGPHAPLEIC
jgi:L-alanine-DL-glutamate epimerase-like enolase superfamily enzyme